MPSALDPVVGWRGSGLFLIAGVGRARGHLVHVPFAVTPSLRHEAAKKSSAAASTIARVEGVGAAAAGDVQSVAARLAELEIILAGLADDHKRLGDAIAQARRMLVDAAEGAAAAGTEPDARWRRERLPRCEPLAPAGQDRLLPEPPGTDDALPELLEGDIERLLEGELTSDPPRGATDEALPRDSCPPGRSVPAAAATAPSDAPGGQSASGVDRLLASLLEYLDDVSADGIDRAARREAAFTQFWNVESAPTPDQRASLLRRVLVPMVVVGVVALALLVALLG